MGGNVNGTGRKVFFWLHLVLGLAAGGVIAITAFTGATMAFEKQIVGWQERDLRRVSPPPKNAPRVPLDELVEIVREENPGMRPSEIVLSRDPAAAVVIQLGRTNVLYANPYTGEMHPSGAQKTRAIFQLMLRWHRWLGAPQSSPVEPAVGAAAPAARETQGGWRRVGGTIVGVSACVFLTLCLSGLVLWWPRNLGALRQVVWFRRGVSGRTRDWNWHNTIGFWSLPVLVVITFTGIVMSFRAVGDWIYKRPENENAGLIIAAPEAGARPLGPEALLAAAQADLPQWQTITLRLGGRRQRGPRNAGPPAASEASGEQRNNGGGEGRNPPPVGVSVVVENAPSAAPTQLQLDPYTGSVLRRESVADYGFRRAFRTLNKVIHTGEAGGIFGQTLALAASLGALVLVWTGFALSWRRFLGRDRG